MRRAALESAPAEGVAPECANSQADLCPEPFAVGFKDRPLSATIKALLDERSQAADRDAFPLRRHMLSPLSPRTAVEQVVLVVLPNESTGDIIAPYEHGKHSHPLVGFVYFALVRVQTRELCR